MNSTLTPPTETKTRFLEGVGRKSPPPPIKAQTIWSRIGLALPHPWADFVVILATNLVCVLGNAVIEQRTLDASIAIAAMGWLMRTGAIGFVLLYSFLVILICSSEDLYETHSPQSVLDELLDLWKAIALATLCLMAFLYLSHNAYVSRALILLTASISGVSMTVYRYLRRQSLEQALEAGTGVRNVLIVGAGTVGKALAELFESNKKLGYVVKGFLDHNHAGDRRVLGSLEDIERVAAANFIDDVFVTIPSERGLVKWLTLEAPRLRLSVNVIPELFDGLGWEAPLSYLGNFPIMTLHHEREPRVGQLAKRALDILVGSFGLVLLFPFLLVVAIAIKLDSPGPILFRPQRVGHKGVSFTCFKFRTMVRDAHLKLWQVKHLNERNGILFKASNDPRITRIGRYLRKYSIDELPQLYNILIGEMSLVGPRPPEISEYEHYQTGHLRRLEVPPGLTGLWQVTARQDPSFDSYLRLDLQYIENWSFWLDLKIIFRTIPAVIRGSGQ